MSDCRWSIGMSDCHVENDRVCRFAALVALAIAVWHVMLGSQAVAAEVDAVGRRRPSASPTLLRGSSRLLASGLP